MRKVGLEKIAEILTVAKQPQLKDHIIHKCSLSTETFNEYLHLLLGNGLLDGYPTVGLKLRGRQTKGRMMYQTSVKGVLFLKRYAELTKLLEQP